MGLARHGTIPIIPKHVPRKYVCSRVLVAIVESFAIAIIAKSTWLDVITASNS
jgi:hypothetical protein